MRTSALWTLRWFVIVSNNVVIIVVVVIARPAHSRSHKTLGCAHSDIVVRIIIIIIVVVVVVVVIIKPGHRRSHVTP